MIPLVVAGILGVVVTGLVREGVSCWRSSRTARRDFAQPATGPTLILIPVQNNADHAYRWQLLARLYVLFPTA